MTLSQVASHAGWLILLPAMFLPLKIQAAEQDIVEHIVLLNSHGIATDTDGIIAYLQRLQHDAKVQEEIAALIEQLSSTSFAEREQAAAKLPTFGSAARAQISAATKSQDAEVAWRAAKILQQLDSDTEVELRRELTTAALSVIRSRGQAKATPVLLETLLQLDDAYTRDLAYEAIWACADPSHAELLKKSLDSENLHVRAAAMVALEIATGENSTKTLSPYLKSETALLRLAAARALVDRQPRKAVETLVELTAEEEDEIVWQADALLQLASGQPVELSDDQTLADAWQQWRTKQLKTAQLNLPLGEKRFDLSAGRNQLKESFARETKSLKDGYGRFLYEADNQADGSVADGKLRLSGDKPEGDQRLYITSQRMIGREKWPRELEVRAKIGGAAGNSGVWHVGVSVGRVKVLFHPGYSSGGFRAEDTDSHGYIFGNEGMGFTPAMDVLQEMVMNVRKTADGAEFDVAVTNGSRKQQYKKQFTVTDKQLGAYNRIGLERSGHPGGAALFDSVSIKLGR